MHRNVNNNVKELLLILVLFRSQSFNLFLTFEFVNLYYKTYRCIFVKLGTDEVIMTRTSGHLFGMIWEGENLGRAKIGHGGTLSLTNFTGLKSYPNKPNAYQWSESMWEEMLSFWIHMPMAWLPGSRSKCGNWITGLARQYIVGILLECHVKLQPSKAKQNRSIFVYAFLASFWFHWNSKAFMQQCT